MQVSDNRQRRTQLDEKQIVLFHCSEVYFHEEAVGTGQCRSSSGMSYYTSNSRTLHLLLDMEHIACNQHTSSKRLWPERMETTVRHWKMSHWRFSFLPFYWPSNAQIVKCRPYLYIIKFIKYKYKKATFTSVITFIVYG
jgi:hypothetical protein